MLYVYEHCVHILFSFTHKQWHTCSYTCSYMCIVTSACVYIYIYSNMFKVSVCVFLQRIHSSSYTYMHMY